MEKPWKCSYGKYIFIETLSGARETKPEFQQKKTSIFAEHQEGMDNKQITERFMDGTIVWNDCFSGS